MATAQIGLIGLAVMGQNLALNIAEHGYRIKVFNRTTSKVDNFLDGEAQNYPIDGAHTLEELIAQIERPRKIVLMVKAGQPVDTLIEQLAPLLDADDIIIDAGNSYYKDTERRYRQLKEQNLFFIGMGVSGGEEGARKGPSLMPGGDQRAWKSIKAIFQSIAAKADDGTPCCEWIGDGGSGHYVKMVHNGIEYGDMQVIAEAYQLLREGLGYSYQQLQEIFQEWNQGVLESYLIEITSRIFAAKDQDGSPMLEKILDVAEQKGTGLWSSQDALNLGIPLTLITEAVFSRQLSAFKTQRSAAAKIIPSPSKPNPLPLSADDVHNAVYAAKIISYAQGFMLLSSASNKHQWQLNQSVIAKIWRAGCIIRSRFLDEIADAYQDNPGLPSLIFDQRFIQAIKECQNSWRNTLAWGAFQGIPLPAISSALAFYDGFRSEQLPSNLIQAQRDFFGAHTFQRTDKPLKYYFHHLWDN
ncbi:MAG: decarboxylating NADP(+)-dependent phosphogluconate dehydrogenase [Chlamydiota bacterium]